MNFNQDDIQAIGETLFGITADDNDYTVMELNYLNKNDIDWVVLEAAFYRNSTPEKYVTITINFSPDFNYGFFGVKMSNDIIRHFRLYFDRHKVVEF